MTRAPCHRRQSALNHDLIYQSSERGHPALEFRVTHQYPTQGLIVSFTSEVTLIMTAPEPRHLAVEGRMPSIQRTPIAPVSGQISKGWSGHSCLLTFINTGPHNTLTVHAPSRRRLRHRKRDSTVYGMTRAPCHRRKSALNHDLIYLSSERGHPALELRVTHQYPTRGLIDSFASEVTLIMTAPKPRDLAAEGRMPSRQRTPIAPVSGQISKGWSGHSCLLTFIDPGPDIPFSKHARDSPPSSPWEKG